MQYKELEKIKNQQIEEKLNTLEPMLNISKHFDISKHLDGEYYRENPYRTYEEYNYTDISRYYSEPILRVTDKQMALVAEAFGVISTEPTKEEKVQQWLENKDF